MKNRLSGGVLRVLVILSLSVQAFAISPADVATTDIRKLVDVKSIRGAKGSKRVAVPGYRVIFTTRSKVVARAEDWLGGVGGGSSSGAKASMDRLPRRLPRRYPALVHQLRRRHQRPGHGADEHPRPPHDGEGTG